MADRAILLRQHPFRGFDGVCERGERVLHRRDVKARSLGPGITSAQLEPSAHELIDGRNRLRACEIVGIPPVFANFDGDEDAVLAYIADVNLQRRLYAKLYPEPARLKRADPHSVKNTDPHRVNGADPPRSDDNT